MKKSLVDNTKNLDLNSTARQNEKTFDLSIPYLSHSTYAVIHAELSYPIGVFNEEKELTYNVRDSQLSSVY